MALWGSISEWNETSHWWASEYLLYYEIFSKIYFSHFNHQCTLAELRKNGRLGGEGPTAPCFTRDLLQDYKLAGRAQPPSLPSSMAHAHKLVYAGVSATPIPFLCLPCDFEQMWNRDNYSYTAQNRARILRWWLVPFYTISEFLMWSSLD